MPVGRPTRYGFTRISKNAKTGPIPTMKTDRDTCPEDCPLKGNGCYGDNFPMSLHWDRLPEKGLTISELEEAVSEVPEGEVMRMFEVGDIPKDPGEAKRLFDSVSHLKAFGYTHNAPTKPILDLLNSSNATISLSANNVHHLDALSGIDLPKVVTLRHDNARRTFVTDGGTRVNQCPATTKGSKTTCKNCGNGNPLCLRKDRDFAVGFPGHGNKKNAVG